MLVHHKWSVSISRQGMMPPAWRLASPAPVHLPPAQSVEVLWSMVVSVILNIFIKMDPGQEQEALL